MLKRTLPVFCFARILVARAPAAKMMSQVELAAFFRAGTGLISPLGQYIARYQPGISF